MAGPSSKQSLRGSFLISVQRLQGSVWRDSKQVLLSMCPRRNLDILLGKTVSHQGESLNVVAAIDAEWSTLASRCQRGILAATMNKEVLSTLAHARVITWSQPAAAFYTTLFSHSCLNYVKPELFCHGQQSSCLFGPDGVTICRRKPVKSLQIDLLKSYYLINCVITTQVLIDRGILWHLLDL